MRGSLSFMRPEPTWKNFFGHRKFANVKIHGMENFKLVSQSFLFKQKTEYSLYDKQGTLVREWQLNYKFAGNPQGFDASCIISQSPKIIYEYGINSLISTISSESENVNAVFSISGSMKRFHFQDIEVHHKDYDPEISFRAPDHKMHEAIIIANFLYSPVLQSANG